MSLLDGVLKTAFVGIKPSWKKLFLGKLKTQLSTTFKKLDAVLKKRGVTKADIEREGLAHYLRPAPEDIFNAFKYCEIEEIKCVIIGQDPYPDAANAHGLSFSVPYGEKVPGSLSKIYDCLYKQGTIPNKPTNGNLEKWAKQGILLLNRYLTRNPQIKVVKSNNQGSTKPNDLSKSAKTDDSIPNNNTKTAIVVSDGGSDDSNMHPFWGDFTDAIVRHLCETAEEKKSYLCLMLWGVKAQEVVAAIPEYALDDKIDIMQWGHPSKGNPANQKPGPKNFDNCDHFVRINEELTKRKLPLIDWDPREITTKKPKEDSKAILESQQPNKQIKSKEQKGDPDNFSNGKPQLPKENTKKIIGFTDGGCTGNGKSHAKASYGAHFPAQFNGTNNGYVGDISGLVPDVEITNIQNGKFILGKRKIQPSNNRGELLGVIMALDAIITSKNPGPWLLVMDSEYCMHMINERIWKWHKKDPTFKEWANPDLVTILHKQLLKLTEMMAGKPLLQPAAATHYSKKTPMDLQWPGLTILHQESHNKTPPTEPFAKALWNGNDTVDKLCSALLA